jgi:hypothetical protein
MMSNINEPKSSRIVSVFPSLKHRNLSKNLSDNFVQKCQGNPSVGSRVVLLGTN